MINKGNIELAINELSSSGNAVAFIYENVKPGIGVLEGSVVTIKDNYATIDASTQASSKLLEGFNPGYDAEVVKRLRGAGATIIGKTHLDELALGGTGKFSAFGEISHPLDSKRIIGGSSSGAAATMTENVSVAIGSDTGDSVRLPASYIGMVGFKPSYGAVSRFGLFPFASSLDTVSWFSHNISDSIEIANVLYGIDEADFTSVYVEPPKSVIIKPKKVTFISFGDELSAAVSSEYEELKKLLISDGIELENMDVDLELFNLIGTVYSIISYSESSSNNSNLNGISFGQREDGDNWSDLIINTRTRGFGEMVKRRFTLGSFFLLPENQKDIFIKSQKIRMAIKNFFESILSDSLLIYPTATIAPISDIGKADDWYSNFLSYSNLIGNPSISIPWMEEDGLSVNISIDGRLYDDKSLLSNALYIEKLLGGKDE